MQVVTFETAKKLKEAGFPQPAFERGQIWCNSANYSLLITNVVPGQLMDYHVGSVHFEDRYADDDWIFAPSATDILQQLPSHLSLNYDTGEFWCGEEKDWNPAEACAAAWLALHKK